MTTKTMATYRLFDDSITVTGSPEQITHVLWRNCASSCHSPLPDVKTYMEWQKRVEMNWSGKTLDITSFETFVNSLVAVGFLLPIDK
jgi:hypothetical protein